MQIVEQYSHQNGKEYLLVHKPQLWKELLHLVTTIDASSHINHRYMPDSDSSKHYSSAKLKKAFDSLLKQYGWESVSHTGHSPIKSYNQTDFVKDRIAIEVQFGKYAFVAYDLFVKHMAFYVGDVIDVGIEILPMKSLQAQMSSGVGYYEGELYNLIRQGRGVPAVPLVLLGVAP